MARALGFARIGMNDGKVVAQSLTAGGRSNDDRVLTRQRMSDGRRLMAVEVIDSSGAQSGAKKRIQGGGKPSELGRFCGLMTDRANGRTVLLHGSLESFGQGVNG